MIYGLKNSNTNEVKYVGRTKKDLSERLKSHLYKADSSRSSSPKDLWINQIGEEKVEIIKLENECENIDQAEIWWMEYLEFLGCELLNVRKSTNWSKTRKCKT